MKQRARLRKEVCRQATSKDRLDIKDFRSHTFDKRSWAKPLTWDFQVEVAGAANRGQGWRFLLTCYAFCHIIFVHVIS